MERNKLGQFLKGFKHPNWKGGFSQKEYMRRWYYKPENKEKHRLAGIKRRKEKPEEVLAYQRKHSLNTNGRVYTSVIKRDHPGKKGCELCYKVVRLEYHHWDDSDLEKGKKVKGMWICHQCHVMAGLLEDDRTLVGKYFKLKTKITSEVLK